LPGTRFDATEVNVTYRPSVLPHVSVGVALHGGRRGAWRYLLCALILHRQLEQISELAELSVGQHVDRAHICVQPL